MTTLNHNPADKGLEDDISFDIEELTRTSSLSDRVTRAKDSCNPMNWKKRSLSRINERRIAKVLGGVVTHYFAAFDVSIKDIRVEVKTMVDGKHDKVTIHPFSRKEKEKEIKKGKLTKIFIVVIDNRDGKDDVYVRQGFGSFRLKNLEKLEKISDLRKSILCE